MSDSTCRKVAMKTMKRVMRWTANISVLAVFSSALAFSQGHSLRPDATADSAVGMFHTARSVGRRISTGAYYTWKGSVLEGTPIEPDELVEFNWRERRGGVDSQLNRAVASLKNGSLAQAS
jgi:hypothetical protein